MSRAKTAQLVHLALMGACVFYAVIGLMVAEQPMAGVSPDPLAQEVVYLFIGLAGAMTIASFAIPNLLLARSNGGPQAWFTSRVIAWAFAESVAVLGLVLFLIDPARPTENLYVFVGWALILMIAHTPRNAPEG